MPTQDWNPAAYARFAGPRLQPALDLLARIGPLPAGDVCDLGCGAGVMGPALRARFAGHRLIGLDTSQTMLEQAADTGAYDALIPEDAATWVPETDPALIYSNAVLHWLPAHHILLPRLAGCLAPGGTLAVQVPHQNDAPSHQIWLRLAETLFPGRVAVDGQPGVLGARDYFNILSGLGPVSVWETEYYQHLPAAEDGHPVRLYTETTFARPVLAPLDAAGQEALKAAYDEAIAAHYPRAADGTVQFPFRRLFFVLTL